MRLPAVVHEEEDEGIGDRRRAARSPLQLPRLGRSSVPRRPGRFCQLALRRGAYRRSDPFDRSRTLIVQERADHHLAQVLCRCSLARLRELAPRVRRRSPLKPRTAVRSPPRCSPNRGRAAPRTEDVLHRHPRRLRHWPPTARADRSSCAAVDRHRPVPPPRAGGSRTLRLHP